MCAATHNARPFLARARQDPYKMRRACHCPPTAEPRLHNRAPAFWILVSSLLFATLSALVKVAAAGVSLPEIVFFRTLPAAVGLARGRANARAAHRDRALEAACDALRGRRDDDVRRLLCGVEAAAGNRDHARVHDAALHARLHHRACAQSPDAADVVGDDRRVRGRGRADAADAGYGPDARVLRRTLLGGAGRRRLRADTTAERGRGAGVEDRPVELAVRNRRGGRHDSVQPAVRLQRARRSPRSPPWASSDSARSSR